VKAHEAYNISTAARKLQDSCTPETVTDSSQARSIDGWAILQCLEPRVGTGT